MTFRAFPPLFLSLFLSWFCLFPAVAGSADLVDRVVGVVNEEVITLSELNRETEIYFNQIVDRIPVSERDAARERVRKDVLSQLIDKMLLNQKAAQMGVVVGEAEVDEALGQILARTGAELEKFRGDLAGMGLSERQYRESLRSQILQSKLVGLEVRSKVVVTDKQVRNYYDTSFLSHLTPGSYYVLQLGVTWDDGATDRKAAKEEARQMVAELRERAADGENFRALASTYSNLPSAADGGDIGMLTREEMAPYMRDTIVGLRPGEVSPVVETASGFQFFKLLASKEGDVLSLAPFESVRREIEDRLHQEEMENQFDRWVTALRDQAYIKESL